MRTGRIYTTLAWAAALVLWMATYASAVEGCWGVGVAGGKVWTVEGTGREDGTYKYWLERYDNSEILAVNATYLWELMPGLYGGPELTVENYELTLSQKAYPGNRAANIGKLQMTPILLALKLQAFPRNPKGWGGHFDIGAGIVTSDFDAGPDYYVTSTTLEVVTRESPVYTIAGGLDYFFARHLAAAVTVRYIYGSIDHTWRSLAADPGYTASGDSKGQFNISHTQLLLGIRAYF